MRELKIPGEVRQLIKVWRERAKLYTFSVAGPIEQCADELEAALKRPIQRAKIRTKNVSRKKK